MSSPVVTVYITNHNYGQFLRQAVQSVLNQKYSHWELIIIDDGSTDGSPDIIREFEHLPGVRVVLQENRGLIVSSNIALRLSRGDYILRLDADDYLDENALVVLSNILDTHPEVGLVYPDYYRITEDGDILSLERRSKLGTEVTLYTAPAHGAGTMIRKRCLLELEGYSDDITCQDGYDLWVRLIERFGVYNVNVPLFYYRQHGNSLSGNRERILENRRRIDRRHAERHRTAPLRTVAIIPVRGREHGEPAYALRPLAGRPLLDYTIDAAISSAIFEQVIVISEDEEVLAHATRVPGVTAIRRPSELARPNTPIVPTVQYALDHRESDTPIDAFMLLYVNTPLRTATQVRNAADVMTIFQADGVISAYEDLSTHYQHVGTGLRPLFRRSVLRLEREALWVENGAIYLARVDNLDRSNYLGDRLAHTVMLRHESLQIDTEEDFQLAEYLLTARQRSTGVPV